MSWRSDITRPVPVRINSRGHFKFYCDPDEVYNYIGKLEAENKKLRKALTEILNSYDSIDVRIAAKALEEK